MVGVGLRWWSGSTRMVYASLRGGRGEMCGTTRFGMWGKKSWSERNTCGAYCSVSAESKSVEVRLEDVRLLDAHRSEHLASHRLPGDPVLLRSPRYR